MRTPLVAVTATAHTLVAAAAVLATGSGRDEREGGDGDERGAHGVLWQISRPRPRPRAR